MALNKETAAGKSYPLLVGLRLKEELSDHGQHVYPKPRVPINSIVSERRQKKTYGDGPIRAYNSRAEKALESTTNATLDDRTFLENMREVESILKCTMKD
jgi:hypothetical protein